VLAMVTASEATVVAEMATSFGIAGITPLFRRLRRNSRVSARVLRR
jgi:hypothetical protein